MENLSTWVSEHGIDWGIKIAIAVAIFIIGKIIARIVANLVKKALQRAGTDNMLVSFLGTITYTVLPHRCTAGCG